MELAKCCEDLRRAPFFPQPQQYQNPVVILQGKPHKSEFRPSNARKRHPIKYAHIWPFFQYFGVDIFPIFFQYFSNIVRVRFFSGTIYGILWPNMAKYGHIWVPFFGVSQNAPVASMKHFRAPTEPNPSSQLEFEASLSLEDIQ